MPFHLVVTSNETIRNAMQEDVVVGSVRPGINLEIQPGDVFYFSTQNGFVFAKANASHSQRLAKSMPPPDVPFLHPDFEKGDLWIVGLSNLRLLFPHRLIESPTRSWAVSSRDPLHSIDLVPVYHRFRYPFGQNQSLKCIDRISFRTALRLTKQGLLIRKNKHFFLPSSKTIKEYIAFRDKHTCRYCLKHLPNREDQTIDHIIPKASKGKDLPFNLVLACRDCNHSKSHLSARQFASLRLYLDDYTNLVVTSNAARDYMTLSQQSLPYYQVRRKILNLIRNNTSKVCYRQNGVYIYCNRFKLSVVGNRVVRIAMAS